MTLVRFNNKPQRVFNNFVDDLFPGFPSLFRDDLTAQARSFTPVNIAETENGYVLDLVAPGLEKEDFKISLEQNILTISAEKKTETEKAENGTKQILKEYQFRSFKRSFNVDEKIDAANIAAKYVNGVLTLNLPKKAEVKEAAKQITIQ